MDGVGYSTYGEHWSFGIKHFLGKVEPKPVRFFFIQSPNRKHLEISAKRAIWIVSPGTENKYHDALRSAEVVLLFSADNTRNFQGYAHMIPHVGEQSIDDRRVLDLVWLAECELPFTEVCNLKNKLQQNRSVTLAKDGTEIDYDSGIQICSFMDHAIYLSSHKRKMEDGDFNPHDAKRAKIDTTEDTQISYTNKTNHPPPHHSIPPAKRTKTNDYTPSLSQPHHLDLITSSHFSPNITTEQIYSLPSVPPPSSSSSSSFSASTSTSPFSPSFRSSPSPFQIYLSGYAVVTPNAK
eukprot:TRINITY_DN3356_c0_g1_i1.p1 TRINITY_DN3356_c0_g1~~TRINITY_DN3356_c0_g1_i1.p1  ORF type:complete len:294 (-),score=53.04 TRINITY_DN3356_c0_g1_i1:36-917(-)